MSDIVAANSSYIRLSSQANSPQVAIIACIHQKVMRRTDPGVKRVNDIKSGGTRHQNRDTRKGAKIVWFD